MPRVRVRQHVNPEKVEFNVPRVERLALPAGVEIEVELGCADAQFLFERAALPGARLHLGLEIRRELVPGVNRKAEALGVPVRAVFAHANVHFGQLFAPRSLARIFVNFPDPWFKQRHRKRRVMDAALAHELAAALAPGGELFFQSDIFDLALDAMAVLEQAGRFVNRAGAWSFWKQGNPYGARSRREETCAGEGIPVWRMLYCCGGSSASAVAR